MGWPKYVSAAAISLLLCAGCAFVRSETDTRAGFRSGGIDREYLIHRPTTAAAGLRPAVLVFHGGGGTAANMSRATTFDRLADRDGFVAVYPEGYERSWNDGRGTDTKAGAAGIDDVAFVAALIDRLVADEHVDPARVYATGLSNGAMFTELLGCRLADRLAAIAPVSGPLPAADESTCAPAHSLPVLEIHGTADPIVPYDGGTVRVTSGNLGGSGHSPVLSVPATQQLWRTKNACGPATSTALPATTDDGTSVTVESADCADGAKVQLYTVAGGGHSWPDGPQYLPRALVGPVTHQFDGAELIWNFFRTVAR